MKTSQEIVAFGQGNVEAVMKSGQILATGWQDLTRQMTSAAQASMDDAMAAFRAMAGIRTVKEAVDLQATLARSAMEKALSQTGQVAQTSFKLAGEAMAPIASRVSLAVEGVRTV